MRRFVLVRHVDVSGVSGVGTVCEGVEFTDGRVATRWVPPHPGAPAQTAAWDSVTDLIAIHGHGGATVLRWLDETPTHIDPRPTAPGGQRIVDVRTGAVDTVTPPQDAGTPLFDELVHPPLLPPDTLLPPDAARR